MNKFFVSRKEYEELEKRYAIMENNYKIAMASARQVRKAYADYQVKTSNSNVVLQKEIKDLKTENRVLKAQLTKIKNKKARESVDNEQE